ncbi:MAG: helix-turn-helix transcriptional regulator [Oscillospiraceae bacterium]|nr:helix-turn-helix transcriptional regulator [Oscillospiraceae bacterium]
MTIEEQFSERLAQLRLEKGVSAREMSLAIGQCDNYINAIENKKNLPSMTGFFYICEYLEITPQKFFEFENKNPYKLDEIISYLKYLSPEELEHLTAFFKSITKKK